MGNFLEVMMRLRNVRNLDARQSSLVDSAYFAVKVGGMCWVRWRMGWAGRVEGATAAWWTRKLPGNPGR